MFQLSLTLSIYICVALSFGIIFLQFSITLRYFNFAFVIDIDIVIFKIWFVSKLD